MIEDATITYIRTFVLLSVSCYRDTHESIFSREKWERVQELLDYWAENMGWKARPGMHFTVTGLVRCGHCGCALVDKFAEMPICHYYSTIQGSSWNSLIPRRSSDSDLDKHVMPGIGVSMRYVSVSISSKTPCRNLLAGHY